MIVCLIVYVGLWVSKLWRKKRKIFWVVFVSNTFALILFGVELLGNESLGVLVRNSYGEGSRTETYEASVEGELEDEPFEVEIGEREYTDEEIDEIFQQVMQELDTLILGENESRDRVEKDLMLPKELEGYPVQIHWELDSYEVLDMEGRIIEEKTSEEGTLVEVRGTISYNEKEALYVTHVVVYPRTKTEREKWINAIQNAIEETETTTKKDKNFQLPAEVQGKEVVWSKKTDTRGYYIVLFGGLLAVLFLWKENQDKKEKEQKKKEQMIRDYPDIISKFALLLSTGMTVKSVWSKIVQNYEEKKSVLGRRTAYEEMCITHREMQSGIPEIEAYERFGKRCGLDLYMKFGALLAQNVKKGSKGFCEILKLESIQAFENRKRVAKQMGEEASTKLLLPMFGMLAVVMIMVIVPAFLSIQL